MTIKAIETRYAGCRFRSRLEARWAVLFDHLGIQWEYEPQGFELDAGRYLPDFYLPGTREWVEVKGSQPDSTDMAKCLEFGTLQQREGRIFLLLQGEIPRSPVVIQKRLGIPVLLYQGKRFEQQPVGETTVLHYCDVVQHMTFGEGTVVSWQTGGQWGAKADVDFASVGVKRLSLRHAPLWLMSVRHRLEPTTWVPAERGLLQALTAARSARFEHGENG